MRRMGTLVATVLAAVAISFGTADATPKKGGPGNGRGRDKTAPTIVCPDDITVDPVGPMGAYVKYSVTVTDDQDPSPRVTYSHPSGSRFPIGTTTVTVTATDGSNNSSTCTFDVTVKPAAGSFHYKMEWRDSDGVVWYAWSITVSADGTFSGSGEQLYLPADYGAEGLYAVPMPDGLTGSGTISGTISADGRSVIEWSYNYWWLDVYKDALTESAPAFSVTTWASMDASGNLYFHGNYGYWVKD